MRLAKGQCEIQFVLQLALFFFSWCDAQAALPAILLYTDTSVLLLGILEQYKMNNCLLVLRIASVCSKYSCDFFFF